MMRRLVVLVALVALVALAVAVHGWWRAGSVPDWVERGPAAGTESKAGAGSRGDGRDAGGSGAGVGPDAGGRSAGAGDTAGDAGGPGRDAGGVSPAAAEVSVEELLRRLAADGRVALDARQLGQVVAEALSETPDGRAFLGAMESVQARIGDGTLEVGGLLDLSRVDLAELSPEARAALAGIRRAAPMLAAGERYVGLRGRPRVRDGGIALEDDATLRIGALGLPLTMVLTLSGQDAGAAGEAGLLRLEGLEVGRVEVRGDLLEIEARQRR